MYTFKNHHEPGNEAMYVKMTKELYYCRVNRADGYNTFHYSYVDDPGQNEFPPTEQQYKAVRGCTEYWMR